MSDPATVCDACGGYGLLYERGLAHELSEAKAEVERLQHLLKDANHRAEETTIKHLNTEMTLLAGRLQTRVGELESALRFSLNQVAEEQAEVERLNGHRDELAADKHRLLLEIRALDDALEQLKQRNRELEAEVANWRHVMEDE